MRWASFETLPATVARRLGGRTQLYVGGRGGRGLSRPLGRPYRTLRASHSVFEKKKKKKNFFESSQNGEEGGSIRRLLVEGRHVQGPTWCRLSRTCVSDAHKLLELVVP